jgi:hypothetical protein
LFLKWKNLIHSYMKLWYEQHYNTPWIKFELSSNTLNGI